MKKKITITTNINVDRNNISSFIDKIIEENYRLKNDLEHFKMQKSINDLQNQIKIMNDKINKLEERLNMLENKI